MRFVIKLYFCIFFSILFVDSCGYCSSNDDDENPPPQVAAPLNAGQDEENLLAPAAAPLNNINLQLDSHYNDMLRQDAQENILSRHRRTRCCFDCCNVCCWGAGETFKILSVILEVGIIVTGAVIETYGYDSLGAVVSILAACVMACQYLGSRASKKSKQYANDLDELNRQDLGDPPAIVIDNADLEDNDV